MSAGVLILLQARACQLCAEAFRLAFPQKRSPAADHDEYYNEVNVNLELWVKGATLHNHVSLSADQSVVAVDNADKSGVEIWTAKYGTLSTKQDLQITIFPGQEHNSCLAQGVCACLARDRQVLRIVILPGNSFGSQPVRQPAARPWAFKPTPLRC